MMFLIWIIYRNINKISRLYNMQATTVYRRSVSRHSLERDIPQASNLPVKPFCFKKMEQAESSFITELLLVAPGEKEGQEKKKRKRYISRGFHQPCPPEERREKMEVEKKTGDKQWSRAGEIWGCHGSLSSGLSALGFAHLKVHRVRLLD